MPAAKRRRVIWISLVCSAFIGAIWAFPHFWYNKAAPSGGIWYSATTNISGWKYEASPVAKSAEAALVADEAEAGEFRRDSDVVRVFFANRYSARQNEIGLFTHTPDRCWMQVGWEIEDAQPTVLELELHGAPVSVERRIFKTKGHRELVYFFGMSNGSRLPFRLDHNLNIAMRLQEKTAARARATLERATDKKYWSVVWDSFSSRAEHAGPKQFLRISTPVYGNRVDAADQILQDILRRWTEPLKMKDHPRIREKAA